MSPVSVQQNKTPVTETISDTNKAQEQELATLKEELAAQEALWARECKWKKPAEEEQRKTADSLRRAKESLRKGHQAYDRSKEEKDKLRALAEVEIERLKEELQQQKDREDRARRMINLEAETKNRRRL